MTLLDAPPPVVVAAAATAVERATVSVCIPARNEAATVAGVVSALAGLRAGLADIVVVDDGSSDGTGEVAAGAGARVVRRTGPPGKGRAMADGLAATTGELVVFLDADVTGLRPHFVTRLVEPLIADPALVMAKATYRRPGEGGRVTELLARPLLERFFPELAFLRQPLAGEVAVRRSALDGLELEPGYGVEIGMLVDLVRRFGPGAIAQVDLGERVHRNRPLPELAGPAREVLDAVLRRL
ncbi:MAG: glycosyltransferase [Acidimicrobiales bacterium]